MTAAASLLLVLLQLLALQRHLRRRPAAASELPFLSVLKPLCGIDDDLRRNLRSFALQKYPRYEVLLGVKSRADAAYPLAVELAARWPSIMRVVVQRGTPGLNPKVNQLITLAAAAAGDALVISDSNVLAGPDYLRSVADGFADAGVALVTHPVAGYGEESAGAFLDNAIMCGVMAPGVTAAKGIAGKDIVVGKSMALRRRDLAAMGGFERLKDLLAEDFICGRIIAGELRRKVALAPQPVFNVSRSQSVEGVLARYRRWSVMQRKAVGTGGYLAQILLNPIALSLAALFASPDRAALEVFGLVWVLRAALHQLAARSLRGSGFGARVLFTPVADLLLAYAWTQGLLRSEIEWRGNRLRVGAGTALSALPEVLVPDGAQLARPGAEGQVKLVA